MPIKTVSIETARLLKDAGFPQGNAHGFWYERTSGREWKNAILMIPQHYDKHLEYIRAVTTDELLEELPLGFIRIEKHNDCFVIEVPNFNYSESNMSLCEGLSFLWINLRKEGFI